MFKRAFIAVTALHGIVLVGGASDTLGAAPDTANVS